MAVRWMGKFEKAEGLVLNVELGCLLDEPRKVVEQAAGRPKEFSSL